MFANKKFDAGYGFPNMASLELVIEGSYSQIDLKPCVSENSNLRGVAGTGSRCWLTVSDSKENWLQPNSCSMTRKTDYP